MLSRTLWPGPKHGSSPVTATLPAGPLAQGLGARAVLLPSGGPRGPQASRAFDIVAGPGVHGLL